jgi:KDO2-lipid IV(A) lauroyltransferase
MALGDASPVGVVVAMRSERDQGARSFHPLAEPSPQRRVVCVGDDPLASLPLLQHLQKGGIVAVQVDRCPAGMKALQVQSGRKTWSIPAGPFALSAACGAPIVLALSTRTGFLSYDLQITSPVSVPRHADGTAQLRAAQKVVRELARHVNAAPTQWFDFIPT